MVVASVDNHLDGTALASALVSGIHRVIGEQDFLNHINVFPVADGDTGTNLSLSLGAALPLLKSPGEKHLGTLLAAFADALLDGARGNSGAIVAQFFQGMSDAAGDRSRMTAYAFSQAVNAGNDYAHDALSEPREGTILSVIKAFADGVAQAVDDSHDTAFVPVLEAALQRASTALQHTQQQLDVLRKAGVVDAGAKGFVALIEGVVGFLGSGEIEPEPDLSALDENEAVAIMAGSGEDSEYRFCTECIVTSTDINRRKLREALAELGDSLVLAGTKRKAKVHIHVNDPERVFDVGRQFGEVTSEKADDMHRQAHSSHDTRSLFAVITDSAADISDDDLERLDIHLVPCRIQFGDRGFLDKVSITANEFFAEIAINPHHPTTSQPSPGDFRRQFQFLAAHFDDVLSINLTAAASGTFQAAVSAAQRTNAPGKIHIINSRNASLGQGQLVVFAAECARAGLSVEKTIEMVNRLVPQTHTYGVLQTMKYAVRGGRLPRWVQTFAKILRVTPFIRTSAEGRIIASGFAIGRRDRTRKFAAHLVRRIPPDTPINVAVGHAACADEASELERLLRRDLPQIQQITRAEIGAGLGAHAGPGTLLVSTQPSIRPQDFADQP
jgi:DegV family protein with EDD domain